MRRRAYLAGSVVLPWSGLSGCISMADVIDVETPAQVRIGNRTDESRSITVRVEKVRGILLGDETVVFDETIEREPDTSVTRGEIDEPGTYKIVAESGDRQATATGEISTTNLTDCNRVRIPIDVLPEEIRVLGVETTLIGC